VISDIFDFPLEVFAFELVEGSTDSESARAMATPRIGDQEQNPFGH
jgi:hypothetical protein